MWLFFLYGILLGISAGIISLIIHCFNIMGNANGYPGLEDVNPLEYEKS